MVLDFWMGPMAIIGQDYLIMIMLVTLEPYSGC